MRRPELDGLRGVAVLLVVFAHATQGAYPSYRGLAPWLESHGGVAGVQLFFVLSGFLITGVLTRGGGLVRFYKRRWRRLYPTLILVTLAVVAWSGDVSGGLRALTYTENIPAVVTATDQWTGYRGALGHTWSLAVEEQFYLCWPVLMLVARRHAAKVAAVGVVTTWVAQQLVGWSDSAVYSGLRWDAVLAGCVLALVPWSGRRQWFAAGAATLAAYALGLVDLGRTDYLVLTLASVACVASAGSVWWLRAGWLRHCGRISYAWYLWHVVVMRVDLPTPVSLVIGLALAELTYMLVDRNAQQPSVDPEVRERDDTGRR
jgi:peptidoglycan/LPS O-acetylase OafA/YrhL